VKTGGVINGVDLLHHKLPTFLFFTGRKLRPPGIGIKPLFVIYELCNKNNRALDRPHIYQKACCRPKLKVVKMQIMLNKSCIVVTVYENDVFEAYLEELQNNDVIEKWCRFYHTGIGPMTQMHTHSAHLFII